ncbi:SPS-sensor component Ssy1p [[Candida] railenensis]|uniref:SPS-sensor component Ssy1p n=1 Tax=[Candida] railenensis TaxID=45579 RepID=A0A9P0QLK3_9ASCO|nr:SPS-sensor component Ssy1p [[Candida] railenensis]
MLDDSDHSDNSIHSIDKPPLFPKYDSNIQSPATNNDEQQHNDDLTDDDVEAPSMQSEENRSIKNLRNILFKPAEFMESVDLSNVTPRHFQTQFEPDSDDDDNSTTNRFSIDSSVINQMDLGDIEESKFKYLSAYQKMKKAKSTEVRPEDDVNSEAGDAGIPLKVLDNSSVFSLSKLDDFSRFVRSSEINDAIYKKFSKKHAEDIVNNNVLDILSPTGLGKDYVGNFDDDQNSSKVREVRKKFVKSNKSSWYNLDWQRKPTALKKKNTEIQEISFQSATPSSSTDSAGGAGTSSGVNNDARDDEKPMTLQRKLKVRHLQMISFGGTLGVGLFLNSGKALTLAGGFGTLLSFIICGIIVLTTMISFCEMVTFVSVIDGVSGLSSRFVDDSFGFAVGWLYFFSFAFGLTGEIVASVIMLSYFPQLKILDNKASCAGFVTLFLVLIFASNLIDVRVFGEVEYISSFIKLISCLMMIIVMIALNTGSIGSGKQLGFKYWTYSKSDFSGNLIFGLFRPTFNLQDDGTNQGGIGGDKGRFLSLLVAVLVVSYAYSGTEIVCIAACEAQNPRKALPSATRRVFWRILIFYCLSAFVVSLNVYAGDPRLLRYYSGSTGVSDDQFANNYAIQYVGGANCYDSTTIFAGYGTGSQSPWIVALQSAKLCNFASAINGFLVFFAVSCGNAQLYVSSRTLYSLALQKKAPKFLTYCNAQGIPYNAVIFSGSFGFIAYLCINEGATNIFQNLTSIISSSGIIVWFAMCLSFIRFYYGLKKRPDIMSRDDKSYPYKSHFQPYSAIIGLVGSGLIIFLMGFVVFLKGEWDTLFFFASYGTLMVFAVLYFGHKFIKGTRTPSLETIDFDSGRREMDRYIWDGGREYNLRSVKDITHKWASFLA